MAENNGDEGFVIKDRRRFDDEGHTRESSSSEEKGEIKKDETVGKEKLDEKEEVRASEEDYYMPEINFASFILSLHTSALFHFGDLADPVTKEKKINLSAAKQTIDMLAMLQEKTKGNLDEDENKLLEGILYELRMRFVKESS